MSPEKAALAAVWNHKRFWLQQSLGFAVWTALALSWFWLPDSHVWGLALTLAQGLAVIVVGVCLIRGALVFYGAAPGITTAIRRPRFYANLLILAIIGAVAPYKLATWRPPVTGLAMQTASLSIRFAAAYALAVTAWLALAALIARLGKDSPEAPAESSSTPLAPQPARPNP
jgi:hypothetical protein